MYSYSYGCDETYCYPNSNVLQNKFGIRDIQELQELEKLHLKFSLKKMYFAVDTDA